jgi:hypothetical protein
MCTVLIRTVKSGQGHKRTINNRNAESRTVSHLLSKWYQTKMNTWSYFAGLSFLFSKLHKMPTLKLRSTMSQEMKSSLEEGK